LSYNEDFDICMDLPGEMNLSQYLSQVLNYLSMIKTNT
jgi:hypothetical protein